MRVDNNGALLGRSASQLLVRASVSAAVAPAAGVIRGREAVVARAEMLKELSRRTGRAGAMDLLEFLVQSPSALEKTPYLVLTGLRAGVAAEAAEASDVEGAVLLYEYRAMGVGTRVFATDDVTGERTVMAAVEMRVQVAEAACHALAARGAWMTLISVESGGLGKQPGSSAWAGCEIGLRRRVVAQDLVLGSTTEETLAALGKHTRRNLRYYRRRAETELGAEFIASVEMTAAEFLDANRGSSNPFAQAEAQWRYQTLSRTPGRLFAGVRAGDGRWLSLIAGRRLEGTTQIDWQLNRAGMGRFSLSTVMRAYLLEYETEVGTRRLIFRGGTPHSMQHSFMATEIVDVIGVRRTPVARLLRRLARWIFPKSIFLGQVLRDQRLTWIPE